MYARSFRAPAFKSAACNCAFFLLFLKNITRRATYLTTFAQLLANLSLICYSDIFKLPYGWLLQLTTVLLAFNSFYLLHSKENFLSTLPRIYFKHYQSSQPHKLCHNIFVWTKAKRNLPFTCENWRTSILGAAQKHKMTIVLFKPHCSAVKKELNRGPGSRDNQLMSTSNAREEDNLA